MLGLTPTASSTSRLEPPKDGYTKLGQRNALLQTILLWVKGLPGVINAAETWSLPPQDAKSSDVTIEEGSEWAVEANLDLVSDGYFQTMGLQLVAGRLFQNVRSISARRCNCHQPKARSELFGNQDPIGPTD